MNKKRKTQFGVLSAALLMALTLQPITNTVHAQETSGEQIVEQKPESAPESATEETSAPVKNSQGAAETKESASASSSEAAVEEESSTAEKGETSQGETSQEGETSSQNPSDSSEEKPILPENAPESSTEQKSEAPAPAKAQRAPRRSLGGIREINGKLYLYDEQGNLRKDNKWVEYQGKYYFPNAQGVLYRDQIITFGPKVAYYMNHEGTYATGFQTVGGWLMYFREDGIRANDNTWVKTERGWVFPNAEGKLYHDRIITFGSKVAYYMKSDGTYATGFQEVDGNLMYFRENGVRANDNKWVETERGWIFPNAQGVLYRNRFITFGPKVAYYMKDDGTFATGFQEVDGNLMYFRKNGVRANDNKWVETERGWIFPNAQGVLYRNRFITFGRDVAYLMGEDGIKKTGLTRFKGALYPLDSLSGKLMKYTPGYHVINGRRYYVRPDGTISDSGHWVEKNGRRYYEKVDGTYFKNQQISFGNVYYYMDGDGATTSGIHQVGNNYYFYDPARNNERRNVEGVFHWKGNSYYIGSQSAILTNQFVLVDDQGYDADDKGILHKTSRLLVIDLSTHQKPYNFDFDTFAKGVSGVILRAGYTGYGTGDYYDKDAEFERFYREFNARGIPIGAYWYSCANEVKEGVAEAKAFQKAIAGKKFSLPVYWDTEDEYHQRKTDKKTMTDTALAFLKEMEKAGYYTGIYASSSWLNEKLDMSRLKNYDVWVAHYGVNKPSYSGNYGMWQFTSQYKKDGFPYHLDANWMFVDYPSIIRNAGLNGY